MATFKVGQRVRIRGDFSGHVAPSCARYLGAEAVIERFYRAADSRGFPEWILAVAGGSNGPIIAPEDALEPLTDPKCTEFIERAVRDFYAGHVLTINAENAALAQQLFSALPPHELGRVRGGSQ